MSYNRFFMKLSTLSPQTQSLLKQLQSFETRGTPWQEVIADLLQNAERDIPDHTALDNLNRMERLVALFTVGLQDDQAIFERVNDDRESFPLWSDLTDVPAETKLQRSLGKKLYDGDPEQGDKILINVGDYCRGVISPVIEQARKDSHDFLIHFYDYPFYEYLKSRCHEDQAQKLGQLYVDQAAFCNRVISARPGSEKPLDISVQHSVEKAYNRAMSQFKNRISSGLHYTLTVVPTERDAEIDGFDYQDYLELFFEMCDQPWDRIDQAHQELIEAFNAAENVHITNSDGTDLRMSIKGFTFANSLIAKNVPGSEIFSAPIKESVEGKVVAKGNFICKIAPDTIIKNITLTFKQGKVVDFSAEENQEVLRRAVELDKGSCFVGELGIGTNPHLKQHLVNSLLVEKIGGSFHVALGRAYKYTEYLGSPVQLDNGNDSDLHWDITTMLYGRDGVIELDGRPIMKDGRFLDQKYDILNRGWQAVPFDERPSYWQNKYPA